jgi:hypothetical protein
MPAIIGPVKPVVSPTEAATAKEGKENSLRSAAKKKRMVADERKSCLPIIEIMQESGDILTRAAKSMLFAVMHGGRCGDNEHGLQ